MSEGFVTKVVKISENLINKIDRKCPTKIVHQCFCY